MIRVTASGGKNSISDHTTAIGSGQGIPEAEGQHSEQAAESSDNARRKAQGGEATSAVKLTERTQPIRGQCTLLTMPPQGHIQHKSFPRSDLSEPAKECPP